MDPPTYPFEETSFMDGPQLNQHNNFLRYGSYGMIIKILLLAPWKIAPGRGISLALE